jgi:DNA-binding MarR family transcriptional regulator
MASIKPLHQGIAMLRTLRALDEKEMMPSQTAECLLVIAANPGISMQKLQDETGLAQSSCSRNVAMLSKWHRLGKPGYDLVEAVDDPNERRRKIVFLNKNGQRAVIDAMRKLDPEFTLVSPTAREALTRIYSGA